MSKEQKKYFISYYVDHESKIFSGFRAEIIDTHPFEWQRNKNESVVEMRKERSAYGMPEYDNVPSLSKAVTLTWWKELNDNDLEALAS